MIEFTTNLKPEEIIVKMVSNFISLDYEFALESQKNYLEVFSYNYKFFIHPYDGGTCIQITLIHNEEITNKDFIYVHRMLNGIQ